jgi:DNA polymerase/3'-5' exonuclease PolX
MKTEFPLPDAERIARGMAGALIPFCSRIEIAGSVRRRKSIVGDVEIVCTPYITRDMFGAAVGDSFLEGVDWTLYGDVLANGPRYKKIMLREGIQLDLFIVLPPAQFGWLFLLKTGPADYSRRMVTARREGGLMPSNLKSKHGAIWSRNHIIETPEEQDVFDLFGMAYTEPRLRK